MDQHIAQPLSPDASCPYYRLCELSPDNQQQHHDKATTVVYVAIESAGLILVESDPLDVVNIIKMSEASNHKMKQNIWWASG